MTRHHRGPVGALFALVAVALLAAACSSAPPDAPVGTGAPAPAGSTAEEPAADATTAGTTPNGNEAALLEEVARLSSFVEAARGLTFKEPVAVHLADDAEFEDLLFATVTDEDWADMEASAASLEALGLVEPGIDMRATMTDLLGAGVLGYYDTETGELVLRGGEINPLVQSTLVHELTHAIDDQRFELDRPELDEATDESGFGFSALVEGNASRVEQAWLDAQSEETRRARDRAETELALEQASRLVGVPPVLARMLVAPYQLGEPFTTDLVDEAGQTALDDAFAAPPTTSEQVMHLDRYLAGEVAATVVEPAADGVIVDTGVMGEYTTVLVLADVTRGATARTAADGWGGDRYVVWRTPDGTACIAVTWTMDSVADRAELDEALATWVAARPGATTTRIDDTSTGLRSCASRPGAPPADTAAVRS